MVTGLIEMAQGLLCPLVATLVGSLVFGPWAGWVPQRQPCLSWVGALS